MIGGSKKAVGWMAKCASTNSSGREGWGPRKAHFKGEWRWGKTMCAGMVVAVSRQSSIREALLQVLT